MSRALMSPARPWPRLRQSVPPDTEPGTSCLNADGRTMVQAIPDAASSASDRACSRPLRLGASWPAPVSGSRTNWLARAARTALGLARGARGQARDLASGELAGKASRPPEMVPFAPVIRTATTATLESP